MAIGSRMQQQCMMPVWEQMKMKRAIRAMIDAAGVLSLIGMVLLAIIATRTDYGQYRIGGER